jgi:hypothetical protein
MPLVAQDNKLLPVLEAELLTRDQHHSSDTSEASTGRENIWHETFKMGEFIGAWRHWMGVDLTTEGFERVSCTATFFSPSSLLLVLTYVI